ncbi:odorant receptor 7a-like [Macrosteles quadrilineatus]|uniref:odorant receptor 7a-like n=1 Tax=Macrosteles quadrilineatus TaxID=74068 RepID=UPI0023E31F2C|nr:odorant receptor 7a-like [Macrosteles quadrilineatus]
MAIPKIDLNSLSLQAIANLIEAIDLLLAVGVYNVFGQMLINESERLSLALYSCDWTDKPRSMRRGLYIMQMMASRPLRMTIGGIYTLGMETYGNILNTVYSYATLIQGLK